MAITTDAEIDFFGAQDNIDDGSTSSITDDSFSVAADVTDWTNDDDAREAVMVIGVNFSVNPSDNTFIHLYARMMNIDGTNDGNAPSATNLHTQLGSFPIGKFTTLQHIETKIRLPNGQTSQIYQFYIQNRTGQTLPAAWTMKIRPLARGPHG